MSLVVSDTTAASWGEGSRSWAIQRSLPDISAAAAAEVAAAQRIIGSQWRGAAQTRLPLRIRQLLVAIAVQGVEGAAGHDSQQLDEHQAQRRHVSRHIQLLAPAQLRAEGRRAPAQPPGKSQGKQG